MCGCRSGSAPAPLAPSGARSSIPGLSPGVPVVIGNPIDGEEPIRIRVVMELDGLRPMQSAWVVGDGVDEAINDGSIILLGNQPQLGRLWRVGQHTYHDKSIAERVAAQTGQTMVEVA